MKFHSTEVICQAREKKTGYDIKEGEVNRRGASESGMRNE